MLWDAYLDRAPTTNSTSLLWTNTRWHMCKAPSRYDAGGFCAPDAQPRNPHALPSCPALQSTPPAKPAPYRRADPNVSSRSTILHNDSRSALRSVRCRVVSKRVQRGRWLPLASGKKDRRCALGCSVATKSEVYRHGWRVNNSSWWSQRVDSL